MSHYTITVEPESCVVLQLVGEFTHEQFAAMLQDLQQHFDQFAQPRGILLLRRNLGFLPLESQMAAGRFMRHPQLSKVAVVGPHLFGGAMAGFIGLVGGRRLQYFETEAAARAFLAAPLEADA